MISQNLSKKLPF